MSMPGPVAQILGDLINDLNPYYDGTFGPGWVMDIQPGTPSPTPGVSSMQVEVDDHYPGDWNFAGQPQRISRALRIKYRYPVTAPSGAVYWLEDYLLIGFEGSGAG
jgi:hypothetical protein